MDDLAICSRLQQLLFLAAEIHPKGWHFEAAAFWVVASKSVQQVEQKSEFLAS